MLIPGHLFKRLFLERRKDHVPEFAKSVKKKKDMLLQPATRLNVVMLLVEQRSSGALVGLETGADCVAMFMVYCSVSAGSVTDRLSSAVPDDGRNFPPLFIC